MHQTRAQASKKLPVPRKGTQYLARSLMDLENSVPVVIAIRDMLKLAKTAKEVKHMIKQKSLKINGREVKDYRDSIRLFNLFKADKNYILSLTEQGKFILNYTTQQERPCKVIGKKILNGKKIQLNLHDGTNIFSSDSKIKTQDTIYLDLENKIKKHLEFSHGKDCLIIKGKLLGHKGKIENIEKDKAIIKIKGLEENVKLEKSGVILL
jgi:small subunit ribosomal protein S4e